MQKKKITFYRSLCCTDWKKKCSQPPVTANVHTNIISFFFFFLFLSYPIAARTLPGSLLDLLYVPRSSTTPFFPPFSYCSCPLLSWKSPFLSSTLTSFIFPPRILFNHLLYALSFYLTFIYLFFNLEPFKAITYFILPFSCKKNKT